MVPRDEFFTDEDGHDAGGLTQGQGLLISWQRGPRGPMQKTKGGALPLKPPNGAFVEDVIRAAQRRLMHFQSGPFECAENREAIGALEQALEALERRAKDRQDRGVLGCHAR